MSRTGKKLDYKFVNDFFETNGCTLLSETYINIREPLKFECICGLEKIIKYHKFKQYKCCYECWDYKKDMEKYLWYCQLFEERQCLLLEPFRKMLVTEKLKYRCTCNNEALISVTNLLAGHKCLKCAPQRMKEVFMEKYGCDHPLKNESVKMAQKATCLERYGKEYFLQTELCREKTKITCQKKYQTDTTGACKEIQEKARATRLRLYGCENIWSNKEFKERMQKLHFEKYGCINPFQREDVKLKSRQSCLEKYGVEYCMKNEEIKSRAQKTNEQKYGHKCVLQSEHGKAKNLETLKNRYNVSHMAHIPGVRQRIAETCLRKYGLPYAISNYQFKKYVMPSGEVRKIQGYECFCLDDLLKIYKEKHIITDRQDVPVIKYLYKNEKHRYYPDIYVTRDNLLIEVKSEWTLYLEMDKNKEKFRTALNSEYNFEVRVYDKFKKFYVLDIEKFISEEPPARKEKTPAEKIKLFSKKDKIAKPQTSKAVTRGDIKRAQQMDASKNINENSANGNEENEEDIANMKFINKIAKDIIEIITIENEDINVDTLLDTLVADIIDATFETIDNLESEEETSESENNEDEDNEEEDN